MIEPNRLAPDIEKVVGKHLRDEYELRVVGKTPTNTFDAWVQLTQIGGPSTGEADHLVPFMVQLDCYAGQEGGQPEANLVARVVRAALRDAHLHSHQEAVISRASVVNAARIPDQDFEPDRERVVLTARVYAHATENDS